MNIIQSAFIRQVNGLKTFARSSMFPIFMIVFVDVLGIGIVLPVIPLYAQNEFGASAGAVAGLTSAYFFAQFIAAPRLGRLSDRVGRRPVLIISQIGTMLALTMSGSAPVLAILYLARTVDGITGGNISVAQAYLNDVTTEQNRTRGMGLINAAFSTGFLIGPLFGAFFASHFGPRTPFFLAAGISVITITLTIFKLPEPLTDEVKEQNRLEQQKTTGKGYQQFRRLLDFNGMLVLLLVAFMSQFAFFSFQSTWVLWSERTIFSHLPPDNLQQVIGYVYGLLGVFGIVTQVWLVGPLADSIGEKRMIGSGLVMRMIAFTCLFLFPVMVPALMAIPLIIVGGGIANPAITAVSTYISPPEQRGFAIGTIQSAQNIGRILGPLIAGYIFDQISPGSTMALAAILILFSLLFLTGLRGVPINKANPQRLAITEAK